MLLWERSLTIAAVYAESWQCIAGRLWATVASDDAKQRDAGTIGCTLTSTPPGAIYPNWIDDVHISMVSPLP
jgi:hypothetical protein